MRNLIFICMGLVLLFVFFGRLNRDSSADVNIYSIVISNASSRYWNHYAKDELDRLSYEERVLVYEFMEKYHMKYIEHYDGPITFGDAIFYQKLTDGIADDGSKDIAIENAIKIKDDEINRLRSQLINLQRLHELALENISKQASMPVTQSNINAQITERPASGNNTIPQSSVRVDRDAVYRRYGVFELEEQLRKSQSLDRQDPQWRLYQTDSPHTQEIRRLLLEARQAADNSMR